MALTEMKCFLCQVISAAWLSSLRYSCNNTGSRSKNWRTTSRHRAAAPTSLLRVASKSVIIPEYWSYTRAKYTFWISVMICVPCWWIFLFFFSLTLGSLAARVSRPDHGHAKVVSDVCCSGCPASVCPRECQGRFSASSFYQFNVILKAILL